MNYVLHALLIFLNFKQKDAVISEVALHGVCVLAGAERIMELYWNKGWGARSFTHTTFDPPNDLRECCNVIYLHAHHLNRRLKESPRVWNLHSVSVFTSKSH